MSKKAKIVLVIVISVVVLLIAGILGVALISANSESSVAVNNTELKKGNVQNYVNATGVVASKDETYVRSLATYEIEEVKVSVGDKVKEGDILCIIDDSTIKTQIDIAESNLQSANMATYNALQTAERRYNELLAASNGQDKATSTQVSITNAKNNLDNAQKAYDKAKEQYEDLTKNVNYASAKSSVDTAYESLLVASENYNDALENVGLVPVYYMGMYVGQRYGTDYSKSDIVHWEKTVEEAREYLYDDPTNTRLQKYYKESYQKLLEALPDAETKNARDAFNNAQTNYDNAKRNLDEIEKNIKDAFENAETGLETAKLAYESAQNDITAGLEDARRAYELALKQAENEPAILQLNDQKKILDDCVVKAEKSGTITAVYAKEGNIANGALFIIEDTDDLKIKATVKQYDIPYITVGQKAIIKCDALDGEEYEGVVTVVAPAATKEATDGSFVVEADVTSKDTKLLIGLKSKLDIIIEESNDVFTVRYDGIGSDDEGDYVLVAEDDGMGGYTAKKVYVTVGLEGLVEAEITSSELKEGDILILDTEKCKDGQKVKLKKNKNKDTDGE